MLAQRSFSTIRAVYSPAGSSSQERPHPLKKAATSELRGPVTAVWLPSFRVPSSFTADNQAETQFVQFLRYLIVIGIVFANIQELDDRVLNGRRVE
jgi:hypothetical protein